MSKQKLMCRVHTNVKPGSLLRFEKSNTSYYVDENYVKHKVDVDKNGKIIGQPIKLNKKERRIKRRLQSLQKLNEINPT